MANAAIELKIRDWAAWTPKGWTTSPDSAGAVDPVPTLLRRRVTEIGRTALEAGWRMPELGEARFIFASRHGEFERTESLLEAVARQTGVSPAEFTLSVHNALAGLLSIARRNRSGHTSIAAGYQSFVFGLIEAISSLEESPAQPVIFVYYDAPLPGTYAYFNRSGDSPLAVAVAIAKTGSGGDISVSCEPVAKTSPNDNNSADDFLHFLSGSVLETTVVGQGLGWHFRRVGAASKQ